MTQEVYLLPDDRRYAEIRIQELEQEIQALGPDFQDAFSQSSETWHDNSPFEAVRDKQSMLAAELHKLRTLIRSASLTAPKKKRGTVGVGSTVHLADGKKYLIAGDWTYRPGVHDEGIVTVSRFAPIAEQLLGKKSGDTVAFAALNTTIADIE